MGALGTGKKYIDLTGMRVGRLTVMALADSNARTSRDSFWHCICDCGVETVVGSYNLRNGKSRSCKCLQRDTVVATFTRHGDAPMGAAAPEYQVWASMIQRCQATSDHGYKNYGGRGIKVCARWKDYANFLADMGRRPTTGHQIDRIDNDGNYEPDNCRWATRREQMNNFRRNRRIAVSGENMTIAQAARRFGVNVGTLRSRLNRGVPPEIAVKGGA